MQTITNIEKLRSKTAIKLIEECGDIKSFAFSKVLDPSVRDENYYEGVTLVENYQPKTVEETLPKTDREAIDTYLDSLNQKNSITR